jgi:hypothetical protein
MRYVILIILTFYSCLLFSQAIWIIDKKTGCMVQNTFSRKYWTISWSGDCADSIANGKGTLSWKLFGIIRDKYIGDIIDGLPNGQGKYIYSKELIYSGEFKNGKLNGKGTKISGVYRYEGQFMDDELNGFGKLYKNDRLIYEGQFLNTVENGYGKMYASDGSIFEGKLENGYYKEGKIISIDGFITEGEWNGFELINGIFQYTDGRVYEGQMKNWKPNGHGKMTFLDGRIETGIWKKGKLIKINGN